MVSKVTTIRMVFTFILLVQTNSSGLSHGSDDEKKDRLKLLEEYKKFEAFVNDKVTSIFQTLHEEQCCADHDKDENGVRRKKSATFEMDDHVAMWHHFRRQLKISTRLFSLLFQVHNCCQTSLFQRFFWTEKTKFHAILILFSSMMC